MNKLKILIVFYICLVFWGCGDVLKKDKGGSSSLQVLRKTTYVDVTLDATDLGEKNKVKDILLSKAEEKGIQKVARDWLNKRFMFQLIGKIKNNHKEEIRLNTLDREFEPSYDNMTNLYEAKFKFSAELMPHLKFAGNIAGIEGGYSIATSHVAIELMGVTPLGDITYFVVAKKNDFNVGSYYQVIGFGKIYHVLNKIAQAEIITSTEEIKLGDLILLLKTKIVPIEEKKKVNEKKDVIPIIKVYPVVEKKEKGIKEMK